MGAEGQEAVRAPVGLIEGQVKDRGGISQLGYGGLRVVGGR